MQPLTMSATAPSQTVYSIGYDFHYAAGNNGNVFGIYNYKDANRNQTFTYGSLNRLTSAQNAGTDCTARVLQNKLEYWGNTYSYDAWGNLLNKSKISFACAGEGLSVTVDAHNWIHASGTDYQYDAAGNMTYDATASLSYSFDQENRLTGASGYTYTYDGDGNRVRKSNGNTASSGTLYWDMTPGVVAETDLAGTIKSEYVFFDGERVARRDGVNGAGGVFYYFSDHLKTASVITDTVGTIKADSDYYPWGGELQFTNNDTDHYKFTGKERDTETGLDYFGARYYSNGLGRWVSADWSATPVPVPYADFDDPQSLNLYGYVRGVPTLKADLDGHGWFGDFGSGLWDGSVGPLVSMAAHPYNTVVGIGSAVSHPYDTAKAMGHAAVETAKAVSHGDGKAIGLVVATVAVAVVTGGAGEGAEAAEAASKLSKVEQLAVNAANGKAAEAVMAETLKAEGNEILGQQVAVRTQQGLRKVDALAKDSAGTLNNVEVKSGNATRNASQVAKDNEIATQGGTYVGKNAPESMRGKTFKVPTTVRKPE
jgi:RHS repeat-associated protein